MSKTTEAKRFLGQLQTVRKKFGLTLSQLNWMHSDSRTTKCCALGAALALKAKTKKELIGLANSIGGRERPEFAAEVLGADENDMFQLECGFEKWKFSRTNTRHPFYRIGAQLRKEARR